MRAIWGWMWPAVIWAYLLAAVWHIVAPALKVILVALKGG